MYLKSPQRQQGFLMPLALFIVIGLGALAFAISRLGSGSLSAAVQETLSVQTLYAADSGAQFALHKILFNVADQAVAAANCTGLNGQVVNYSSASMSSCQTTLACRPMNNVGGNTRVFFVESVAQCGGGDFLTERTVEVAAIFE